MGLVGVINLEVAELAKSGTAKLGDLSPLDAATAPTL